MRKLLVTLIICGGLAFTTPCEASQNQGLPGAGEIGKLGAFIGTWNVEGEMKESRYSKAIPKSSSKMACQWAANHGFLICDQVIQAPGGVDDEMSLYTYSEKQHAFVFVGVSQQNPHPRTPKLTIEGNLWTYSGEFQDGAKHIQFRTTNKFTTPRTVVWRSEYSEDGTNWVLMGEGTNTRID